MRCFVCWRYAPKWQRWPVRYARPIETLVNVPVCDACYAVYGEVPWGVAADVAAKAAA